MNVDADDFRWALFDPFVGDERVEDLLVSAHVGFSSVEQDLIYSWVGYVQLTRIASHEEELSRSSHKLVLRRRINIRHVGFAQIFLEVSEEHVAPWSLHHINTNHRNSVMSFQRIFEVVDGHAGRDERNESGIHGCSWIQFIICKYHFKFFYG